LVGRLLTSKPRGTPFKLNVACMTRLEKKGKAYCQAPHCLQKKKDERVQLKIGDLVVTVGYRNKVYHKKCYEALYV